MERRAIGVFAGEAPVLEDLRFSPGEAKAVVDLGLNGHTVLFIDALPGVDRFHGAPPLSGLSRGGLSRPGAEHQKAFPVDGGLALQAFQLVRRHMVMCDVLIFRFVMYRK